MPYSTQVSLSPISFLYRKRTGWSTSFISRVTDGNLCLNEFYSYQYITLRVNTLNHFSTSWLFWLISCYYFLPGLFTVLRKCLISLYLVSKQPNLSVVLKWSSPDFLKVFLSCFLLFCFGFFHSFPPVLLPGHFRGLCVCLLRHLTLTYESFSFKINLKLYLWGLCYYQLVTKTLCSSLF